MFYLQVMSNISVDGEGRFGKGRCPKCQIQLICRNVLETASGSEGTRA